MLYFTGSKPHNIKLRKIANEHGWKLNEYGLFEGESRLAGQTEEEIYGKLSLAWIPPELREDTGELTAAGQNQLPNLLQADDLRGDLHCHTTATDGQNTIGEMAEAASIHYNFNLSTSAMTDRMRRWRGGLQMERPGAVRPRTVLTAETRRLQKRRLWRTILVCDRKFAVVSRFCLFLMKTAWQERPRVATKYANVRRAGLVK